MIMKAAIYERYGPPQVVEIRELPKPAIKNNQLLIKVLATTVNSADWRIRSCTLPKGFGLIGRLAFGITKPRNPILGTNLAGIVEEIGSKVTRFKPGDRVLATPGASLGGHTQYKAMKEGDAIAIIPDNVDFKSAAAISFGGTTALYFLRDQAKVQAGDKVLVNGASGSVGTSIIQLAKYYGAEVTAVCSRKNESFVKSLGADKVIDYTTEDFTQNGDTYDIIADTVGTSPWVRCKDSLKQNGRLLLILASFKNMLGAPFTKTGSKKIIVGAAAETSEYLETLLSMVAEGKLDPAISQTFTFEEIIKAHELVDSGRKNGNLVVEIDH